MRFSVLSSGSKANSTFVEAGGVRLLIDCGLTAKETEERLFKATGLTADALDGVLVTHEHSDHVRGLSVLTRRFKIPVYCNRKTRRRLEKVYAVEEFTNEETFWIGSVRIRSFSIAHDAVDPVGFTLEAEGLKFSQVTDLGRVTEGVRDAIRDSHALVIESNHDQEMLRTCSYPSELKQRIASSHGHLCNETTGALVKEVYHRELQHVVLGHISENSNTPALALSTFERYVPRESLKSLRAGSVYQSTEVTDL